MCVPVRADSASIACLFAPTRWSDGLEDELAVVDVDGDLAPVGDLATDQLPRERIADGALDQTAERPRAVRRVVTGLGQPGSCGVGGVDADPAYGEPLLQQRQLQVDDVGE